MGGASGLTTGNPRAQAIGSWALQVWESLGRWADYAKSWNTGRWLLGRASLGRWADYRKAWDTGYGQLGEAGGLTTGKPGTQAAGIWLGQVWVCLHKWTDYRECGIRTQFYIRQITLAATGNPNIQTIGS